MPFPSTRVIPAGWSKHHQVVAAGGMNATVQLLEPSADGGDFDPDTGDTSDAEPTTRWTGRARIQVVTGEGRTVDQAEQMVTFRGYLVQLDESDSNSPVPDDVAVGWLVKVTAALNDVRLAGRSLIVDDVQSGSERFTRDLMCNDNLG
ncbi:DUF6093 family protein [Angustibacter sp. McL0619]|uniref:DUF6093 family protein n=1 Tax=Angustibacter sp. McL0619 TaxID=3415676 RepID=UPI003CF421E2